MNLTSRSIFIASPNAMRLAEHSAGIHIEAEPDCLGCEKDAPAAEVLGTPAPDITRDHWHVNVRKRMYGKGTQ